MNTQAPSPSKARGRPESLSLSNVLGALSDQAQSAPAIADVLGVSRATVHRKLTEMLERNLVVAGGRGRASTYRLPSIMEQIEAARAEVATASERCRLVLDTKSAYRIVDDLDLAMRIGMGQFEIVEESIRDRLFGPAQIVSDEAMSRLASLIMSIKVDLLGLSRGASHGILSPNVDVGFVVMRSLQAAIRHRLAWDQNPRGSIGVYHDEPIERARVHDQIIVYSLKNGQPDEGECRLVVIEASKETFAMLLDGVRLARRMRGGDFMPFVELAQQGRLKRTGGAEVQASHIEQVQVLVGVMVKIWREESERWSQARRDLEGARGAMQAKLIDAVGEILSGQSVQAQVSKEGHFLAGCALKGDEPMYGVTIQDLPAGYFLNRVGDRYRVIGPDASPDRLRIYAESASPQTAVLMAHNVINGAPSRAFDL